MWAVVKNEVDWEDLAPLFDQAFLRCTHREAHGNERIAVERNNVSSRNFPPPVGMSKIDEKSKKAITSWSSAQNS